MCLNCSFVNLACECNGQAETCHTETGRCFCTTKGVTGEDCGRCDTQSNYAGNPINGSCFYDLQIDYQFTFNLSKEADRHYTRINFRNSPTKPDIDADFHITCSILAKMNISYSKGEYYNFQQFNWFDLMNQCKDLYYITIMICEF